MSRLGLAPTLSDRCVCRTTTGAYCCRCRCRCCLLQARQGVPACCQGLVFSGRQLQDDLPLSSYGLAHGSTLHLVLRLRGGKGGFGALLRGQGRDGNITTNFDACRDLQGRRLRHVEGEKKVKEWKSQAKERELEKVAMRHIRDKAREARKEEAEKVRACGPPGGGRRWKGGRGRGGGGGRGEPALRAGGCLLGWCCPGSGMSGAGLGWGLRGWVAGHCPAVFEPFACRPTSVWWSRGQHVRGSTVAAAACKLLGPASAARPTLLLPPAPRCRCCCADIPTLLLPGAALPCATRRCAVLCRAG